MTNTTKDHAAAKKFAKVFLAEPNGEAFTGATNISACYLDAIAQLEELKQAARDSLDSRGKNDITTWKGEDGTVYYGNSYSMLADAKLRELVERK